MWQRNTYQMVAFDPLEVSSDEGLTWVIGTGRDWLIRFFQAYLSLLCRSGTGHSQNLLPNG